MHYIIEKLGYETVLGESPIFNNKLNKVLFIDIHQKKVIQYCNNKFIDIQLSIKPGFIAWHSDDNYILGAESSLYVLKIKNNSFELKKILTISQPLTNRINDGKIDKFGNIWFGTMDENEKTESGELWMYSPSGILKKMFDSFVIGNGLDWSNDYQFLYYTCSIEKKIIKFSVNWNDLKLLDQKEFISFGESIGFPDGLINDGQSLLVALWNGSEILKFNYDGLIIDKIKFQNQKNITSMCKVGDKKIFVTSARDNDNLLKGNCYIVSKGD